MSHRRLSMKSYHMNIRTPHPVSNKKIFLRAFGLILFFGSLIFGIYLTFFSGYFKIENINITGGTIEDTSMIKAEIDALISENYWSANLMFFDANRAESKIKEKFNYFASVSLAKKMPDTIEVSLTEREPALVWEIGNKDYLIDATGVLFKEITDKPDNLPVVTDNTNTKVTIGQQIVTSSFVNFVKDLVKKLPTKTKYKISKIVVKEVVFDIYVYTTSGIYLIMDTTRLVDSQIANLNKAIADASKHGFGIWRYIDLRLDNKVFYK